MLVVFGLNFNHMDIFILCTTTILLVILIESLLSLDNSIVIAMIANRAKPEDREKVVKYGIIGAYLFRGLSIFLIGYVLANPLLGVVLKWVGGIYLLKLGLGMATPNTEDNIETPSWIVNLVKSLSLPAFAALCLEVELIDSVFSIDNLLATVAMTEKIPGQLWGIKLNFLTCVIGVFLGILTMRFITVKVMKLIELYPALKLSAAIVIGLLGIKMIISALLTTPILGNYFVAFKRLFESHVTDYVFSALTVLIFLTPLIRRK